MKSPVHTGKGKVMISPSPCGAVPKATLAPVPTVSHQSREKNTKSKKPKTRKCRAPYLIQDNPSLTLRHHSMNYTNRSPTDSLESRSNWAYKQRCILDELHKSHPPSHEAVLKFQSPVGVETLKRFQKSVREKLAYWVRVNGEQFSVYFVVEGECSNCVHYHMLIRTTTTHPRMILRNIVAKASQGMASLQHCEAVESVTAITRYIVKDLAAVRNGEKEVLLFKKGLRLRHCGQWNGYFVKPKKELWEQSNRHLYGASRNRRSASE